MSYTPTLDEYCMNVTLGYPMSREECEEQMRRCGATWEDYETEEACYEDMASMKFDFGFGSSVYGDDDGEPHYIHPETK